MSELTRHDLTDGAWVVLKPVEHVRARDRKAALVALAGAATMDTDGEITVAGFAAVLGASSDLAEAVAAMLLTEWSIPYLPDVPPSLVAVGDLRTPDYDALLTLIEPSLKLFLPASSAKVDDHQDPASPSGPVSA